MIKEKGIFEQFNRYTGDRRSDIKDYDKLVEYRGFDILRNAYVPNGAENKWEIPELKHIAIGGMKTGFFTVSKTQAIDAVDKWFELNEKMKEYV